MNSTSEGVLSAVSGNSNLDTNSVSIVDKGHDMSNNLDGISPGVAITSVAENVSHSLVSQTLPNGMANAKLGEYNGEGCLETFLARFQTHSQYKWSKADQLFALQSAMVGPAGQLTWEIMEYMTVEEFKETLHTHCVTAYQIQ